MGQRESVYKVDREAVKWLHRSLQGKPGLPSLLQILQHMVATVKKSVQASWYLCIEFLVCFLPRRATR